MQSDAQPLEPKVVYAEHSNLASIYICRLTVLFLIPTPAMALSPVGSGFPSFRMELFPSW